MNENTIKISLRKKIKREKTLVNLPENVHSGLKSVLGPSQESFHLLALLLSVLFLLTVGSPVRRTGGS